jgi:HSP20 family protein
MKLMRFQRPAWPVLNEMSSLREEINRLFEQPFNTWSQGSDVLNAWSPALDLYEDKDNLIVRAEVPGLKKEEIDISLQDGRLALSGERKFEKKYEGSQTSREERFFGKFQRSIDLPKAVNAGAVKASYKDGILTVTLPKTEEAKPRQITVNG